MKENECECREKKKLKEQYINGINDNEMMTEII